MARLIRIINFIERKRERELLTEIVNVINFKRVFEEEMKIDKDRESYFISSMMRWN